MAQLRKQSTEARDTLMPIKIETFAVSQDGSWTRHCGDPGCGICNMKFGSPDEDTMPATVEIALVEGGEWLPFRPSDKERFGRDNRVHAIRFANGREWDAVNGWRPKREPVELDYRAMANE